MNFRLLKKTETQRFYQLDFDIAYYGEGKTISGLFKNNPVKLIEGYEVDEPINESINKVCVSDARTHIERLVFPAFYIKNKKTAERDLVTRADNICGYMTFMIHGGDPESIYSDEVYLRFLRKINRNKET